MAVNDRSATSWSSKIAACDVLVPEGGEEAATREVSDLNATDDSLLTASRVLLVNTMPHFLSGPERIASE